MVVPASLSEGPHKDVAVMRWISIFRDYWVKDVWGVFPDEIQPAWGGSRFCPVDCCGVVGLAP